MQSIEGDCDIHFGAHNLNNDNYPLLKKEETTPELKNLNKLLNSLAIISEKVPGS